MKKLVLLILLQMLAFLAQSQGNKIIDLTRFGNAELLWDLQKLSKAPEIQWLDRTSPVQSLLYKSVDYEGHQTQVFAYYSNPDLLKGEKKTTGKFPGIVLIHGGGGKAFKEWVEKWAAEGYAAIAMDLSGNDGGGKKLRWAGADQSDENKFGKMEAGDIKNVWTYHAVASVILAHSMLLSFPGVDPSKTCVTGISWGGYLTCIVASLDDRFKAAAPVYGCAYYDESDFFKFPLQKLPADLNAKWMRYFDPSSYLPFAKPQFLFVNGNKDRFYNVVPYDKTYRLVPAGQRAVCLIPDMKHGHQAGWEPHEIRYFFENVLFGKTALPKVTSISESTDEISSKYESPVSLWTADFYYSNDTISVNEQRGWTKSKADVNPENHTVSVVMPKEGFRYGFFYLRDHRNVSISSEFIIH